MIKELRRDYPLLVLCRVLGVSRSGFHAWLDRKLSQRAQNRERLELAARAAHERTRETYGARRLQEELAATGFRASLGTVKQVRRELELQCVRRKRSFRVATTDSAHSLPVAPNLLKQRFSGDLHDKCTRNHRHKRIEGLVADIEWYIRKGGPWRYRMAEIYYQPDVELVFYKLLYPVKELAA